MTAAFRSLLFISMAPLAMTVAGCECGIDLAGRSECCTEDDCDGAECIHDDDGNYCDPGWE